MTSTEEVISWQIVVLVSEEEYERIKERAGYEPLSSYCRRVLMGVETEEGNEKWQTGKK